MGEKKVFPGTIDVRVINGTPNNLKEIEENLNLCVNAIKTISGSTLNNIPLQELIDRYNIIRRLYPHPLKHLYSSRKPYALDPFVWFVVSTCVLSDVSPVNHPELFVVLEEGEDFT